MHPASVLFFFRKSMRSFLREISNRVNQIRFGHKTGILEFHGYQLYDIIWRTISLKSAYRLIFTPCKRYTSCKLRFTKYFLNRFTSFDIQDIKGVNCTIRKWGLPALMKSFILNKMCFDSDTKYFFNFASFTSTNYFSRLQSLIFWNRNEMYPYNLQKPCWVVGVYVLQTTLVESTWKTTVISPVFTDTEVFFCL